MITTGPFTVAAGQTVVLQNPYPTSGQADRVQIQNPSSLVFQISSGVETIQVPANFAAVIPVGAQPITLTASGTGKGPYRLAWLMPKDPQPVPNGTLAFHGTTLEVQLQPTGSSQSLVVPSTTTTMTVDMAGGAGGGYLNAAGGAGGRVQATFPVVPGETLTVFVGLAGTCPYNSGTQQPGGYGAAPGGDGAYVSPGQNSGSGGGASGISRGSTPILIAGAGGGCGINNVGGAGGGQTAQAGGGSYGGAGGTQTAGGNGGSGPYPGSPGSSLQGGNGGGSGSTSYLGGGGGGGYYGGGGGGGGDGSFGGAGGGGSDFIGASAGSVIETPGYQQGDGYAILTYST